MSWQHHVGRYVMAVNNSGWRYPEVCIVAPRQNGKTTILLARIIAGLLAGERIMHTAQNRELPREIFGMVADVVDPSLMRHPPRVANGQERIDMHNGGVYRIVAPTRGGARGPTNDLVIVDELREFTDFDFVAAAKPTLMVSERPQMIYVYNAGHEGSVVLNSLRRRAGNGDADYCYLEWSAPESYAIDDRKGWKIANPAIIEKPHLMVNLERDYRAYADSGALALFETENLCRWTESMATKLVDPAAWMRCQGDVGDPAPRVSWAFNMDTDGKRASLVRAWLRDDGRVAVEEVIEAVADDGIDTQRLGQDIRRMVRGARQIGYASWTDRDLARYVPSAKAVDSKDLAAASEQFVRYVQDARVVWTTGGHIADDLAWVVRRPHESGAYLAVPAVHERSVTSALAAVRALWLASAPRSLPRIG